MEGAELVNQENNHVDRLMQYLDENLTTLSSQLNPDNFERTLTITFDKLNNIMYELVENGIEVRMSSELLHVGILLFWKFTKDRKIPKCLGFQEHFIDKPGRKFCFLNFQGGTFYYLTRVVATSAINCGSVH